MKKLIFISTIIVFASFIFSCNKNKEEAYYQFTQLDDQKLLTYTEGQVLNFKNQIDDEWSFTIAAVHLNLKTPYTKGMGILSQYFYYDEKIIALVDSKMDKFFNIIFRKLPINIELAKENVYKKYPSSLYATIQYMQFWNSLEDATIDFEQPKIEMTINGKTFSNVFVLASGSNSIIENPQPNGEILIRDVNVIYYDEIEGIIGFDDLNGNEWRIIE